MQCVWRNTVSWMLMQILHKQWVWNINFFYSELLNCTTYWTGIYFRNVTTNVIEDYVYRSSSKYMIILSIIHHHLANMELGHLLTRFVLTHPEVSSVVTPCSFCFLFYVIFCEAFCLHVANSFFCIPLFVQDWH